MISYVNLIGQGEEITILDAARPLHLSTVLIIDNCINNTISMLSIIKGFAGGGPVSNLDGGGMHISSSNPILSHITFRDNLANDGGALYLNGSSPLITNVTIKNNEATGSRI